MTYKENKEILDAIKELRVTLENHMVEVKPFLDGWKGAKIIGNLAKWIAGLIIAVAAAIVVITKL